MSTDSTINDPEAHLEGLGDQFMAAVQRMEKSDVDGAAEIFRRILQKEPRLAEPRIELARILLAALLRPVLFPLRMPYFTLFHFPNRFPTFFL